MGYIKHHAIVVTSWNEELFAKAHKQVFEIFGKLVSNVVKSLVNSTESFFVAPDGSKEGWEDSAMGDNKRAMFIEWINAQAYSDGSNSISYAELYYGEDNGKSEIINHN